MKLPPPHHPLQLVLGLLLWSLWFVIVYGGLSLACAHAPPVPDRGPWNPVNGGLLLLSLATAAVLLGLARNCWRAARPPSLQAPAPAAMPQRQDEPALPVRRFVALCGAALHLVAALSTLFIALPLAVLPACL